MADDAKNPAAQWVEHPTGLALIPAAAPPEINETEPAQMAIRWEDWLDLWLAALERLAWCHPDGLPNPYKVPAWFTRAARRRLNSVIGYTHRLPSVYAFTALGDAASSAVQDLIWRPIDIANPWLLPPYDSPPAVAALDPDGLTKLYAGYTDLSMTRADGGSYQMTRTIEPTTPEQGALLRPHGRILDLDLGATMTPPPVPWLTDTSADGERPAYDDYAIPTAVRPCADDLARIVEPIETLQLNAVARRVQYSAPLVKVTREARIDWAGEGDPPIHSGADIYAALDAAATVTESASDCGDRITLSAQVEAYAFKNAPNGKAECRYFGRIEGARLANLTDLPDLSKLSKQTTVVGVELALAINRIIIDVDPARWRSGTQWQCSGLNAVEDIVQAATTWLCPSLEAGAIQLAYAAAGRSIGEIDSDFDAQTSANKGMLFSYFGEPNCLAVLARDGDIAALSTYTSGSELPYFSSLGAALSNPDAQLTPDKFPATVQSASINLKIEAYPILTVQYYPTYPKIKRKK